MIKNKKNTAARASLFAFAFLLVIAGGAGISAAVRICSRQPGPAVTPAGLSDSAISAEEEVALRAALQLAEKAGPNQNDARVAPRLYNLAVFYYGKRQFAEAEPLLKRALAIYEKSYGLSNAAVLESLDSLALLYSNQRKYTEALPLAQRALTIREEVLGQAHPDVATGLNNLAWLYCAQGNYQPAEPLYRRALAIKVRTLGPNHPDVATGLENYVFLLRQTNRQSQADNLEAHARAIRDYNRAHANAQIAQAGT